MASDALLKSLYRNLADLIPWRTLVAWGWSDFQRVDHRAETAAALAAEALIYLGKDQMDNWRESPQLVQGMVAFAMEYGARQPENGEWRELRDLLNGRDEKAITEWFERLFR